MTDQHSPQVVKRINPTASRGKVTPQYYTDDLHGFEWAITQIKQGHRVTKVEWNDPEYFLELRDGRLQIHKPAGTYHDLIVSDGDLFGADWVLV